MRNFGNEKAVLQQTENFIQRKFEKEGSGHDWWHIYRVRKMALFLAEKEGGDKFIIEMAALLHDLDDWKINKNPEISESDLLLQKLGLSSEEIKTILKIIEQVSFKGANVETKAISLEAKIIQDADRLDAIGAIGIARTFAYGGNKNRLIYNPDTKPQFHNSFDAYKKSEGPTINHFHEKLLLLKDRINTETAKVLAEHRHRVMENFLNDFFSEWDFGSNNI